MSTLHDALEAMDKTTPRPWIVRRDDCHFGTLTEVYSEYGIIAETNQEEDTPVIAAAPDALAWIKEALPWIKKRAEVLRTLLILARAEKDEAYAELIADASEELAAIDALIARAKGDNHA